MSIVVNELKCVGCGLCVAACPREAVHAYGIARVDIHKCRECFGGMGMIGRMSPRKRSSFLKNDTNWKKACIRNCPAEALTEIVA